MSGHANSRLKVCKHILDNEYSQPRIFSTMNTLSEYVCVTVENKCVHACSRLSACPHSFICMGDVVDIDLREWACALGQPQVTGDATKLVCLRSLVSKETPKVLSASTFAAARLPERGRTKLDEGVWPRRALHVVSVQLHKLLLQLLQVVESQAVTVRASKRSVCTRAHFRAIHDAHMTFR
eukprot:6173851-Pleurochrysis_carterae.AAC.1